MRTLIAALAVVSFLSVLVAAADQPRVFVTDSKSWEISGGGGGTDDVFAGGAHGGARPQTAEIIKTFGERCPNVTVNMKQEKADYVVVLEHEGGKSILRKDNKVAVFDQHSGDSIYSHSTASLGNSVKDACAAIHKHWNQKSASEAKSDRPKDAAAGPTMSASAGAKVQLASGPPGAEIEIDGAFVGSTPSSVLLAPGDHVVVISKAGYKPWERKIRVTAGEISLNADLENSVAEARPPAQ